MPARLILSEKFRVVAGDDKRVVAHFISQFRERHLRAKPFWIFCNGIHCFTRVVADQIEPVAQNQKRLKTGADAMPRKLKIADAVIAAEQFRAQRAQILREAMQKFIVARADVDQHARLVCDERHNRPFVKNNFSVLRVHLPGAGFDAADGFVQGHAESKTSLRASGKIRCK